MIQHCTAHKTLDPERQYSVTTMQGRIRYNYIKTHTLKRLDNNITLFNM